MTKKAHPSIAIMDKARAICDADGKGFIARSVMPMGKKLGLIIQIPAIDATSTKSHEAHLGVLVTKLTAALPEVQSILTMMGEKLIDTWVEAVVPNKQQKAELARLFQLAEQICIARGARVNAVVPTKDGCLVDINVFPLEGRSNRQATIREIENRIKALPGVLGLAYVGIS